MSVLQTKKLLANQHTYTMLKKYNIANINLHKNEINYI
jgi:hypothetical protein